MSKGLPPPDTSGTDANAVLRSRVSITPQAPPPVTPTPPPAAPIPAPYPGTEGYGQQAPQRVARPRSAGRAAPRRPSRPREDPPGMARVSYYLSKEAAAAVDLAVEQVLKVLGSDVSKHVALSAIVAAGAARAGEVASQLAAARAAELAAQVEALRQAGES